MKNLDWELANWGAVTVDRERQRQRVKKRDSVRCEKREEEKPGERDRGWEHIYKQIAWERETEEKRIVTKEKVRKKEKK